MVSNEKIIHELNRTGFKYQISENIISCPFNLTNNLHIIIIIFSNDNPDWISLVSNIGNIKIFEKIDDEAIFHKLLRLNSNISGPKFSLDKNSDIICRIELYKDAIKSEILKNMMLQMVQAISMFYKQTRFK